MNQDDDELDTALPPLSDADEAYVRDLLASLPPVPVPDDLAARLDAALAAEAVAGGPSTHTPAATATVVPLAARRADRAARSTRILQVAAAALIVVAGGLGAVKLANHGSSSQSTAAGAPADSSAANEVVTHSGHAYSDATLVADVRSLAAQHAPAEGTLGVKTPLLPGATDSFSPQTSPTASGTDSTRAPTSSSRSQALIFGLDTRPGPAVVACLAAVEDTLPQPVVPLAMDQGSYRGQAALIVVLPGSQDPKTSYDVFVVGVGCGVGRDAHLLYYQLVEAH